MSTITATRIAEGTRVVVRHDLGVEGGTVTGGSNPAAGEQATYLVRFDDDTYSWWPAARVTSCEPDPDGHLHTLTIHDPDGTVRTVLAAGTASAGAVLLEAIAGGAVVTVTPPAVP